MLTLGWRAAFYLAGAAGIGLAMVWYWLARDRPEQHPWLNHTELRYITQGAEEPTLPRSDTARSNPWPALLRNKSLWCVTEPISLLVISPISIFLGSTSISSTCGGSH
jgi:ACS family glucarate transporter-like MFS transporter